MADVGYVRDIVERVSKYWDEDRRRVAEKILDALEKMSEEKANSVVRKEIEAMLNEVRKMKSCIDSGGDYTKCGNPLKYFVDWLDSPSGIIAFTYMWKPRFAEKILRLVSSSLVIGERLAYSVFK